jgi:dTDP-4-amino-4,6-dideoxygalactose transaminase
MGDAAVVSLHAAKLFHTLEGGAIATTDAALAARLRRLRNFGFTGPDRVEGLGTNAKLNEAAAAMGLTVLEEMGELVAANRTHAAAYGRRLDRWPGLRRLRTGPGVASTEPYVVLEVDPSSGMTRDQLMGVLRAEGVLARRYFFPGCHRMEPYASERDPDGWHLPVTEGLVQRLLCLPTGAAVAPDDVEAVCDLIDFALEHAVDIRDRLEPDDG